MLERFNNWLEPQVVQFGRLVRQLTGWVPVQIRRSIRLAAMGLVLKVLTNLVDFDLDDLQGYGQALAWSAGIAVQEAAHRALSPATPDREQEG